MARTARPRDASAPVESRFGELAADYAAAPEFAHWHEIAVVLSVTPFVTPADFALQPRRIDLERNRLVFTVHVLRDGVAEHAAQHRTANDRCAIAVARGRAEQATGECAEDRARRSVAAVAIGLIAALLIKSPLRHRRRGRSRVDGWRRRSITVVMAVAVEITVVIVLAVIAIRIGARLRRSGCDSQRKHAKGSHGCGFHDHGSILSSRFCPNRIRVKDAAPNRSLIGSS